MNKNRLKYRLALAPLGLLAVLLSTSCAPAATATAAPDAASPTAAAAPLVFTDTPALRATEVAAASPQPIATSRGPNLEATDPSTVSLASGGLQLVEFFRFT
ncbi:MAG TPA: hypothetical protein VGJ22_02750 [Anaerolineales bacterium]|jgi:hypothetical protein